jgi:hypothetical protein
MFQDLDDTLQRLLSDPVMAASFNDLLNAEVSFETPDRNYAPSQATLNLFLYEVKENRELRDNTLTTTNDPTDGFRLRRPPIRLDCAYLATTWSMHNGAARVAEEHTLLGQAMRWLSRFSVIPGVYLQGSLVNQAYPPPIHVAQADPNRDAADFWTAMGIAPRTAFYLLATITMDLDIEVEIPLVTTTIARYRQGTDSAAGEELININGFVFDAAGTPVSGADVSLAPDGKAVRTDGSGRYSFFRLRRGVPYVLTAGKPGLGQAARNVEVPSLTGEYDVRLP